MEEEKKTRVSYLRVSDTIAHFVITFWRYMEGIVIKKKTFDKLRVDPGGQKRETHCYKKKNVKPEITDF